jgi:uncharacterized protein
MTIVVAGGSGFLGTAVVTALRHDGHRVLVLTRRPRHADDRRWDPANEAAADWMRVMTGADAVINLAGESIAQGRWSDARKRALRQSRVQATAAIVRAVAAAEPRPKTLISASAVGFYGNRGDEILTEDSAPGSDFLAALCRDWERLALEAGSALRVVRLRTGLVLQRHGGTLRPLEIVFRLFAGGPVGSGRQYMSWIHIDDWVAIVRWVLANDFVSGALNLTAPHPVTNAEFAKALGRALHRPAIMPAPAFAVRLLLGEMGDALLLNGQRVMPARAQAMGFRFQYETLDEALRALYDA